MFDIVDLLSWLCAAGALLGAAAYVYGYILKSRGDRRWHTAGLLFSGFGLANLPLILRHGAEGVHAFNAMALVTFLLLGMGCQIIVALRQRKSDRRVADRARTEAPAQVAGSPAAEAA